MSVLVVSGKHLVVFYLNYKIYPDICILGKALGNGYPINAVLGTKEVMSSAKLSFISSTFWSDRIGPAAALKTIEVIQRDRSWIRLIELGNFLKLDLNHFCVNTVSKEMLLVMALYYN